MTLFESAQPLLLLLMLLGLLALTAPAQTGPQPSVIVVDSKAAAHPFPHFWEQMFGSGRAILTLRESYRHDLREVKQITGFTFVRFHAIFHDEAGLYDEDARGNSIYNFSYVDQIYDGLLADGVKPFVELSFMPRKLAAREMLHPFWYRPNISPPKDWNKWDAMIAAFTRHLVERYGLGEVSQWYFEVWNEPNLDFWGGEPRQSTYFELYEHTARTIKSVNPKLRVGGPATAQAAWADAFIEHCTERNIPLDFVSSHVYANDTAKDVFGTAENIPRDKMVCRAIAKVHQQIQASPQPNLPLIWSEFNASYKNETDVTDSTYMGPWMADTIRQCDGLVDIMSYWTFSDVFEEQGVVKTPFYGGFGLQAAGGIPKPAFNAFKLLHQLGDERLTLDSDSALLTRRPDGALVLAVWNYAPPGETGSPRSFILEFKGTRAREAMVSIVDPQHGDVRPAYEKMGSPKYPAQAQIDDLRRAAQLPAGETRSLEDGKLHLTLSGQSLALIVVK
ncbi:MAG TPA: hypothetical protein VKB77_15000 [Terriglobales bacterium]|nr:hypothetical protein [Terriglobales bacterium]